MIGASSILEKIQTGLKELESCRDELESSDEIQCALTVAEAIYQVDGPDYLKSAIARWTWSLHQLNAEEIQYWGRASGSSQRSVRVALTAYLPFDPASMPESLNWALGALDREPEPDDPLYSQWLTVNRSHVQPPDLDGIHGAAGDYLQRIAHSVIVAADELAVGAASLRSCIDTISQFPSSERHLSLSDFFNEGMDPEQSSATDFEMTDGSVLSYYQQARCWRQAD